MNCPECHARMIPGYTLAREGVFFFRNAHEPEVLPFAEALPETAAYMRRAYLEAYKCPACRFILIRFGKQVADPDTFEHK